VAADLESDRSGTFRCRYPQVGFVWQNGQMDDLNNIADGAHSKNWIQFASGINDSGHIVGPHVQFRELVRRNEAR